MTPVNNLKGHFEGLSDTLFTVSARCINACIYILPSITLFFRDQQ